MCWSPQAAHQQQRASELDDRGETRETSRPASHWIHLQLKGSRLKQAISPNQSWSRKEALQSTPFAAWQLAISTAATTKTDLSCGTAQSSVSPDCLIDKLAKLRADLQPSHAQEQERLIGMRASSSGTPRGACQSKARRLERTRSKRSSAPLPMPIRRRLGGRDGLPLDKQTNEQTGRRMGAARSAAELGRDECLRI